jgi:hypothetical protein
VVADAEDAEVRVAAITGQAKAAQRAAAVAVSELHAVEVEANKLRQRLVPTGQSAAATGWQAPVAGAGQLEQLRSSELASSLVAAEVAARAGQSEAAGLRRQLADAKAEARAGQSEAAGLRRQLVQAEAEAAGVGLRVAAVENASLRSPPRRTASLEATEAVSLAGQVEGEAELRRQQAEHRLQLAEAEAEAAGLHLRTAALENASRAAAGEAQTEAERLGLQLRVGEAVLQRQRHEAEAGLVLAAEEVARLAGQLCEVQAEAAQLRAAADGSRRQEEAAAEAAVLRRSVEGLEWEITAAAELEQGLRRQLRDAQVGFSNGYLNPFGTSDLMRKMGGVTGGGGFA